MLLEVSIVVLEGDSGGIGYAGDVASLSGCWLYRYVQFVKMYLLVYL